ncbi:MAG: serpin family protein, partial [candidate division WOR-3 bacterium]
MKHRVWMLLVCSLVMACAAAPRQGVAADSTGSGLLARASNRFGLQLLAQLAAAQPQENVVISPFSIATALQMTLNGAAGETKVEMERTLELSGMGEVNPRAAGLRQELTRAEPKIKLTIANSLWAHQRFPIRKPFLETNRRYFAAQVTALDFARPDAVTRINRWVSENTNGLIRQIVTELDPAEVMLIINAVYFK